MSAAPLLAGAAGVCAAGGLGELVALVRARPRVRRRGVLGAGVRRLGRALGARAPRGLPARMAAAGVAVPVADVVALKAGLALLAALVALPAALAAPGRLGIAVVLLAPAAGFFAPDAWLYRRAAARRRAMEAELADVLDLLRVAVAAGLPPRRALAEVGRRHAGVLAAELRRAAARTALGEPAERALADMRARSPATGVAALVDTLTRAERHGAPLAATLAAQAAEARSLRAQRAAEAAARAAPKIQLVVALLLVPAVLLLVAAALAPALAGR
ncbi:MAG TPA: type II secretion system F family protein [Solirubrobacteraceae bacterium]